MKTSFTSLRESVSLIYSKIQESLDYLKEYLKYLKYLKYLQYLPQIIQLMEQSIQEDKVSKLNQPDQQEDSAQAFFSSQAQDISSSPSSNTQNISISSELQNIVQQFNDQNKAYFSDSRFAPLGLTQESSQGSVGESSRSRIQLESFNDINKDSYLRIELDGDNWLIPNAASPYLRQIFKSLEEYPQIFSVATSGINKLTLIKPAKLKEVSSGIWEIAEIGEFET
jgi:hypothetical protein